MKRENVDELLSILFRRDKFKLKDTVKWLDDNEFIPIKSVHRTPEYYRYRMDDPKKFKTFKTDDTITSDKSIMFVYGNK